MLDKEARESQHGKTRSTIAGLEDGGRGHEPSKVLEQPLAAGRCPRQPGRGEEAPLALQPQGTEFCLQTE